jgi:hypothetical protein
MTVLRRAAVLLLVAALVLAVGDSLAGAKKHKKRKGADVGFVGQIATGWPSEITLSHPTNTHFEGTVSSKLDACRNQRYVIVYYQEPATPFTQLISVQRTTSGGRYQFDLPKPAFAGQYQAQVTEERIFAHKAPQICKGALSPVLTVTG